MSINIPREVELLHKARSGDRAAVELLYETYLKNSVFVQRLLTGLLAKPEDRDDALHDILVTILESKTAFRGESQLSTYIVQIARLTLFQRFRRENTIKRGGWVRKFAESEVPSEPTSTETPYYSFVRKERREIMHHLIDELPDAYREAVRLRAIEDLSYEEVAERLEISYNTASTKIHKGKRILMEKLKNLGYWKAFHSEK
ncbi:MAG: RNA polymerase sigma factor [Acidobacteria bacterium]|nr:RNA polymerase sigma factor [Acidobacteriota bacterium]